MTLKLYHDLLSQPSRALYILLKATNSDFEPKPVDLKNHEHLGEEYAKITRFKKVPVIDHDGFILTESVAILKYLSRENVIPDSLYPKDSKLAARVDEFLAWHHIGIRLPCTKYVMILLLEPMFGKAPKPDAEKVAAQEKVMTTALEEFETKWLSQGHPFVTGDRITIADLMAACELEQPRMAGYNPMENYPKIAAWYAKVKAHFNPYYDEAHAVLNHVVATGTF